MDTNKLNVIKLNGGIYYATWTEYFTSLVVHNLLFPNTAYSLVGFVEDGAKLCAVLRQPFIKGQQAKLEDIKALLTFNGFTNSKRQDYFNEELVLYWKICTTRMSFLGKTCCFSLIPYFL